MAKKKDGVDSKAKVSFEEALVELETIVAKLEDGQLGLDDSLAEYEQGVRRLKQCYQLLEKAERKIQLLQGIDEDGNPIAEDYDDSELSLDEKAENRGKRRTSKKAAKKKVSQRTAPETVVEADEDNVDEPGGLF